MAEKDEIGSKADRILSYLKLIREPKKETRKFVCCQLLKELNYTQKLEIFQLDAFLIKAVHEAFGKSTTDADIMLMALGLMEGYDYNDEPKVGERRAKYLRESNHLKNEEISYDEASPSNKDAYRDNLRKTEDAKFKLLTDYWGRMKNESKNETTDLTYELNEYIDKIDGNQIVRLPLPGYAIRERYRTRKNSKYLLKKFSKKHIKIKVGSSASSERTLIVSGADIIKAITSISLEIISILLLIGYISKNGKHSYIFSEGYIYEVATEQDGGMYINEDPQETNEPSNDIKNYEQNNDGRLESSF